MIRSLFVKKFVKFCIVGGTGVFVNLGMALILKNLFEIDYRISAFIAIQTAIVNNFIWNYLWTWKEMKTEEIYSLLMMFVKFYVSSGITAVVVNMGILVFLKEVACLNWLISHIIGIGFGTIANFLISHFWTFSPPKTGN